jgi:hypothetical protein
MFSSSMTPSHRAAWSAWPSSALDRAAWYWTKGRLRWPGGISLAALSEFRW